MVPPFTIGFFNGRSGKKLEEFVSNSANNLITRLQNMKREMDAESERLMRLKNEAVKSAQDKIKAEAKKAKDQITQKAKETNQTIKEKVETQIESGREKLKEVTPKAKDKKKD
ncbi:unnamed protein product [Parnassius apollo]|uniref:(apollo) hypothetical protein n=1 Tax=Parnassius apollo TaxID=110799 RepID=A0A8S3XZD3_PARAO|nr:unnamed protein product [Parnassius apollo]